MRLLARGRVLDDIGQTHDLAHKLCLGLPGEDPGEQAGEARIVGRRSLHPSIGCLAQDRGDSSVGVLDVVDRVLVRLLLGQLDVEVDAARRGA